MPDDLMAHLMANRDADWDEEVKRRAELCLIDSLTCFVAGRSLQHLQPAVVAAGNVLGANTIDPSPFATAYLYGQTANALDFDDMLLGHPGSPIVGATLAIAAREGLDADRILRGIAAGYDAHFLLAAAARPSRSQASQVRSVGVWDTVAATLAISVALSLDDAQVERAIGVAVTHSLIPFTGKWYERPVPMLKNNLGWVAAGAVLSVELALAGQSGITRPFDGDAGMWAMVGSDRWEPDPALRQRAAVLRVGFKRFPACWHLQEYLTTADDVIGMLASGERVTGVLVRGPADVEKFSLPDITTGADIAFSLPATISLLIERVEPGPAWDSFVDASPELAHRRLVRYERSAHRALTITTSAGRSIEREVDVCDELDASRWGLNTAGVLAKHARWAGEGLLELIGKPSQLAGALANVTSYI